MAQHFETPLDTGTEPRAQRMTADESRAVIDLWQQERVEQTGLTDKPAVPDVAEGLDITVEDVRRLLQDVRAKRLEEERALAAEQELSEIRLAEEERKLAEVRRQRAELGRQQAEAERGKAAGWTDTPRRPRSERLSQSELGLRYIKQQTSSPGYKAAGVLIVAILAAFYGYIKTPHLPARVYVTHAAASYDAQGKASVVDMTCSDGAGNDVPCDDATVASETQYFQEAHDKEVADAKAAGVKKQHDKQTHR